MWTRIQTNKALKIMAFMSDSTEMYTVTEYLMIQNLYILKYKNIMAISCESPYLLQIHTELFIHKICEICFKIIEKGEMGWL